MIEITKETAMSEFKTYEERMAERSAAGRAKAQTDRAKQKPTFALFNRSTADQKAFEMVVRNPTTELRDLVKTLGYTLTEDMANRYAITVSTPAEMDAARNPIKHLFDAKGEWVG